MINLEDVSKSYDEDESTFAVRELSLSVERGELLVLLGESGCGKTTTLKMINRLVERTGGRIEVDGEDVGEKDPIELRRHIGYVFQGIGLFPHMTVAENVGIIPKLLGWRKKDIRSRVDELLSLVELDPSAFGDQLPSALSGGQQQRVGVARALAARPKTMLMDEPLGALDPITRDTLQDEYRKIHHDLGLTTVMVTHDMTEALLMADRIAVMSGGRILQLDTPHRLLSSPEDEYVEALMQSPRRQMDRLEELVREAGASER